MKDVDWLRKKNSYCEWFEENINTRDIKYFSYENINNPTGGGITLREAD